MTISYSPTWGDLGPCRLVSRPAQAQRHLLVDASALGIRAWMGHQDLRTRSGRPSGHVFGVLSMLLAHVRHVSPLGDTLVWWCYDGRRYKVARRVDYPEYKAKRDARRDKTSFNPMPEVRGVLHTLPGLHVEHENCEADDAIAWVVGLLAQRQPDAPVVVLNRDSDAWFLTERPGVRVYDLERGWVTAERVAEKFLAPAKVHVWKAVNGDTTDDITPGVPFLKDTLKRAWLGLPGVIDVPTAYTALEADPIHGGFTGAAYTKILERRPEVERRWRVVIPRVDELGPACITPPVGDVKDWIRDFECATVAPEAPFLRGEIALGAEG